MSDAAQPISASVVDVAERRERVDAAVHRRLFAIMWKETIQIFRDPSSMLIAFVLPIVLLFLFGYGVNLDSSRLKVGIAVEDRSAAAEDLLAAFRASEYFDVSVAPDRRLLEADLVAGRIRGLVVIPDNFSEIISNGEGAPQIHVVADGTEPNTAKFVQSYARGVFNVWRTQSDAQSGAWPAAGGASISVEPRFWFNPELSSRNTLVPGSIAIVMTLIGTLLTALVVAREWERGTMEAMMATPIGVGELLVGKLAPYLALGLVSMLVCTALGVYHFGVPLRGSLFALLIISTVFLLPALGQGLVISAVTKNQFVASQLALVSAFLPSFMLSGFIFEISSMPRAIQLVTQIVPARYLIPSLQSVFLVGDLWSLILPHLAALAAIGAVFFALAARVTKKRVE